MSVETNEDLTSEQWSRVAFDMINALRNRFFELPQSKFGDGFFDSPFPTYEFIVGTLGYRVSDIESFNKEGTRLVMTIDVFDLSFEKPPYSPHLGAVVVFARYGLLVDTDGIHPIEGSLSTNTPVNDLQENSREALETAQRLLSPLWQLSPPDDKAA